MTAMSIDAYAPDFPQEKWSEVDRYYLEPFFTNPDGFVTVLHNLPSELTGALCSRASRAKGSLLRVFLDEYIYAIANGDDEGLRVELAVVVDFLHKHGFKNILNNQRAQGFYARWLSQYGDDSIAQLTGTHLVFWGISQVAMKFLEDQRIGLEPIEKSTRYVNFGGKVNGNYLYYVPKPDLEHRGFLEEYKTVLDNLFDTYVRLLGPMQSWLKANFDEKDSVLEKKAFDTLRGLLPMATLGQVAFRGNAQAFEYMINRCAKHELGELRWIASSAGQELKKEIPSLLLRLDDEKTHKYQNYLAGKRKNTAVIVGEMIEEDELFDIERVLYPEVQLPDYDHELQEKIITAILFSSPGCHADWDTLFTQAYYMSEEEKRKVFTLYLEGREARWQKVGRAFENSYLFYEIIMNIGAYRDLHRHRMLTQDRQMFSIHHGYDVPKEVEEAGLKEDFCRALEAVEPLFLRLESEDPALAQYVVPLAYRISFYQRLNVRELFWEIELRTIPQGHPDYRFIVQEMFRLFKEKFPLIAEHMMVDMNNYPFARRGEAERIQKREERITSQLQKDK